MKYLFVTWAGGGNVPPAIGIAAELRAGGADVRFLGHPCQRREIESAGFAFEAYAHARPWSPYQEATGLASAVGFVAVFTDRGAGRDFVESVTRDPVDVIVIDCMMLGVLDAAKQRGLPYAVLMHTVYPWLIRKWSRGPLGVIAAAKRLRPQPLWASAELVLVTSSPELTPHRAERPMGNVVQTGPILAGPIPSGPDSPAHPLNEARPKVLVSLSTIYYQGQREALGSLITTLSGMNVDAIVTTGDSVDPSRLPRAGNVEVCRRVSHDQVMPTVSLVVCHGGHGTTMKALAHGVPVLIMPLSVHLDHRMIGEMVVGAGAGRMIRKTDTPQQLRQVIEETLNDAMLKTKAARLGAILRSEPGAAGAAARLRALRAGAAGTSAA